MAAGSLVLRSAVERLRGARPGVLAGGAGILLVWLGMIIPDAAHTVAVRARSEALLRSLPRVREERSAASIHAAERDRLIAGFGPLFRVSDEAAQSEFLLRKAHQLTAATGARLLTARPGDPTVRSHWRYYPLQLSLRGTMSQVVRLLLLVRRSPSPIGVDRFSLRVGDQPDDLDVQITLVTAAWTPQTKSPSPTLGNATPP